MSTTLTLDVPHSSPASHDYRRVFPSEIYFTQSSIKSCFQDGRSLMETARQVARHDIDKSEIVMMRVVSYNGRLWSLDNRRLAVFRLLAMTDKVYKVKVEVVPFEQVSEEWYRKRDAENDGVRIRVRQTGEWVGQHRNDTTVDLSQLINAGEGRESAAGQHFSIFLATITDE